MVTNKGQERTATIAGNSVPRGEVTIHEVFLRPYARTDLVRHRLVRPHRMRVSLLSASSGTGGLLQFSPTQHTQRHPPEGLFDLTAVIPEIDSTVDTLKGASQDGTSDVRCPSPTIEGHVP